MTLPPRRAKKARRASRWRSPSHCNFIRDHACIICHSFEHVEVAHIRIGTDCGMGTKPSDFYAISLCREHHAEQHRIGERSFASMHKVDMLAIAERFAKASPKAREIRDEKRERGLV